MPCHHGFDSFCKECRKDDARIEREYIKSGRWIYAVVPWTGKNDYRIEQAVKTFKRKSAAEAHAEILNGPHLINGHGYVVRVVNQK
jgi:hypothetical protein